MLEKIIGFLALIYLCTFVPAMISTAIDTAIQRYRERNH